jgi:CheY-like chemotaxis protein
MRRLKPPLRVLIVEDEALLAMDMESMVEDSGHEIVAEAASLHDVEALRDEVRPDLAFVDIQLARGTNGLDVCRHIRARWHETFIIFVTANPAKIPDDFCGAHGVIAKPFSRNGLMSAMHYITQGVCDPPPTSPRPASFLAAPAFAESWATT